CTQPVAAEQVSVVQRLLSSQLIVVCTQPVAGAHESAVQALLSLQLGAGPPTQTPPAQVSAVVHAFPSLQARVVNPVTGRPPVALQPLALTVQTCRSSQAVPAGSSWQVDEQQSPLSVLPSSHCSLRSSTPLPQMGAIWPTSVVNWSVWRPLPGRPGPWMR